MKTLKKFMIFLTTLVIFVGCTDKFDQFSKNPNDVENVSPAYILTYSQKHIFDFLRDEWFGGRSTFLLAQYWGQINYTDEDRYNFRTDVTQTAWRQFYLSMMNLEDIIRLNSDAETKQNALVNGPNEHQIAVAMLLEAYMLQIITDTWGDVPFSEAFLGQINRTPKFDKQEDLYPVLLKMVKDAVDMIDVSKEGLRSGDIIYNGDMNMWKKFGNSLRLRIALRMKAKDATEFNAAMAIPDNELIASNDESAIFTYAPPTNGPLYDAWFTDNRNDFTISKTLVDLMKGVNDSLNNKTNPFAGKFDPRLPIFCTPVNGLYLGMPYGMVDAEAKAYAPNCPNFKNDPPVILDAGAGYPLLDYAEVCFIKSEGNNWDQAWYEKGIRANMEAWGVATSDIDAYMSGIAAASMETVLTQKYIALYPQPEQAWFEYRRTGYPKVLLMPGEIAHFNNGANIVFTPLPDITVIPRRLQYPIEEAGINTAQYNIAVSNMGGDELDVNVWWAK